MNPTRLLLVLVVLLTLGGGAWLLLSSDHQTAPAPEEPTPATTPDAKAPGTGTLVAEPGKTDAPAVPVRKTVEVDTSGRESPQGVKGIVLSPSGAPEPNCKVFLVESAAGTEIFRMMQLAQRGITLPPVASTSTDAKGAFALGIQAPDPARVYEVRILSGTYADFTHPGVRLIEGNWYDAGSLQLLNGIAVTGQVTVAGGGGMPIADAEVSIRATQQFEVSIVPGRERGIVVKTDASGSFRATNVPTGVYNISAVAPGYARVTHPNVTVNEQSENRLNFELAQGLSIAGKVLDSAGAGIAGAKVTAVAMSSKTPVNADTFADDNGMFEILGLLEGPYQLTAKAEGYVEASEKPISAGTKDVELVAEKQCSVRVTVLGKNGQHLREYAVTVKSYFSGQPQPQTTGDVTPPPNPPAPAVEPSYGNTMIPVQNVRNPRDGVALIEGMDPGTYALQVTARGYAMAFSEPFTLGADSEPPLLTVQLNEGGVIAGVVVDGSGQPIAGATVETRPNDLDDNPFTSMFAGMIPAKITRTQVQTSAQGRFELKLLNAGRYQLKFTHPEYVDSTKKDNEVVVGQTLQLQPVVMLTGSTLTGIVRVAGKPTGQVKVTVSAKTDPNPTPQAPRTSSFMCEAFTDNEGRYLMPKRLAPGLYEIMAAQQTLANPLLQIVQFQRSKQDLNVPGQGQLSIDFNLEDPK